MHTGRLRSLEEVIEHYDRGGWTDSFAGKTSVDVRRFGLTRTEKDALVRFMLSLEGQPLPSMLTEAPALPVMK